MRIGYILTTFPSRTETFALREIESLHKLGFDVMVLAAAGRQHADGYTETVKVLYRPSRFSADALLSIAYMAVRYPLALARLACLMLKLVRSSPREAISIAGNLHTIGFFARNLDRQRISHLHACFLSWPACIALGLSVATHRDFSISAHSRDIFVEQGAAVLKIARASFVRACTRQGLNHLKSILPARHHNKMFLNYHGVSTRLRCSDLHASSLPESGSDQAVIAVGRLIQKKGFADLVRAFALVIRKKPNSRLTIVGQGPLLQQLKLLVEQLGLEDNVRFSGWQGPDATLALMRKAAVLVAPSTIADDGDRDGIPNTILEAFAAGVPVIASDLEGIREVVEHRQTGLLVKTGDVNALASAIEQMLNDRALRDRLSKKAYEMAAKRFDPARNAKLLAELFMKETDAR